MSNRLGKEASPYLLQHAHNPVDWYPWGEEALLKARAEDKPILLSIGYSSCHWCHVMERESFEDDDVAAVMNDGFVNIKVDREERPDLDSIYMRAIQASMGRGGWPLTAFLTPDGRFFFGGTYFPPEPRQGMPSFRQVLAATLDAFLNRRDEVEEGSARLLELLKSKPSTEESPEPETFLSDAAPGILGQAARSLWGQFDPKHGGFGPAPKFPQPTTLEFLLRYHHRSGEADSLTMALTTLRAMARGGIRDHLGGGFHRYSVDARWLVPHFEKMLYDNGLLANVYLSAFQVSGDEEFLDALTSTLDYILDDLRSPDGGFYSARDADSEGEEGLFYLWSPGEVQSVLGDAEAELFNRAYDITQGGNFEGRNILNLPRGLESLAEDAGLPPSDLKARLGAARETLRKEREDREPPFRDEKVLVGWNSFVLRALSEAGAALGRTDYLDAAEENARFLLRALRHGGRLHRSWKDGDSRIPGFLEDYAGLGNALLSLFEGSLNVRWLEEAKELADLVLDLFWDEGEGLFYDSPRDGEELVVRPREVMDNATPSGNSLAIELLLRLSSIFGTGEHRRVAIRALSGEIQNASRYPAGFGRLLSTLCLASAPPVEVVLLADEGEQIPGEFLEAAHKPYLPHRVVVGGSVKGLPDLALLEGRKPVGGTVTAYVCRDFTCTAPIQDPESLARALEKSEPELTSGHGELPRA